MTHHQAAMLWRRRQAKWKTYRLHRARWIFYSTPNLSGRPCRVETAFLRNAAITPEEARRIYLQDWMETRP